MERVTSRLAANPIQSGIFFLASGSVALNQFTERGVDSQMKRTSNRPIPAGKISPGSVIWISSLFLAAGSFLLAATGIQAMIIGLLCVALYNFIYTPLKKVTSLAILPGAIVGALPPLIGFVSAGGILFSCKILLFSTIIFMWQLPHFWLLLIRYEEEYKAAGFKTISAFLNERQIRHLILFCVMLSSVLLMLFVLNFNEMSNKLAYILIILNFVFILLFSRLLLLKRSPRDLWSAFFMLNSFGLVIMSVLIADSLLKSA